MVARLADAGILTPDILAILAVLYFFLFTDPLRIVVHIDQLGGRMSPLIGWTVIGFVLGCVLSVVVRVRDFGWFGSRRAVSLVPNLEHLRAGERTVQQIRKGQLTLGATAVVLSSVFIGLSWWNNSRYAENLSAEQVIARVREAAHKDDIALINRALSDAVVKVEKVSGPESLLDHLFGLKVLSAVQLVGSSANGPVRKAGEAAAHHIGLYRTVTVDAIREGGPGALLRSQAFSEINKAEAFFWMGSLHEAGKGGAQKNFARAFSYYEEAARLSHSASAKALEKLAIKVIGDKDEAVRKASFAYFEPKAKQGDPWAQYWLGKWYWENRGDARSRNKAVEMFLNAANQDMPGDIQPIAFIALTDIDQTTDEARRVLDKLAPKFATGNHLEAKAAAYAYLERRAVEGDPGAQLWTGYRYREGDGIAKDLSKAQIWFTKAATQDGNVVIKQRALVALLGSKKGTR